MKFDEIRNSKPGDWRDVTESRFIACCDCGLTHEYDFRVNPGTGRIQRRVWAHTQATRAIRRQKKHRFMRRR